MAWARQLVSCMAALAEVWTDVLMSWREERSNWQLCEGHVSRYRCLSVCESLFTCFRQWPIASFLLLGDTVKDS